MAPDRFAPHALSPSEKALLLLTREFLLERSEHYTQRELVAYLDGWTTALELMQKTDLVMPGAPEELRKVLSAGVERVRKAQYLVLDEDEPI